MAVTISQSPTLPNGTQSDIIYVLSSDNSALPQHRFICQISSEGGTVLSQVNQVRNQDGYGVFEISRLLDDHMGFDEPWLVSGSVPVVSSSNENIKSFGIKFGEEYGTSPSSSLTSSINVSASVPSLTTFIPAVTERDAGYFNWASSSYDALTNMPNTGSTLNSNTKNQSLLVSSSDYMTISSLSGISPKGNCNSARIDIYNTSDVSTYNSEIANPFGTGLTPGKLVHFGIGPKNLETVDALDFFFASPTTYPYYSVTLQYANGDSTKYFFNLGCTFYKGTRFAFINKLGVFDYYRATLVDTEREAFNRKTYQAPYINYSNSTSTLSYNSARRGQTQYYASFDNTFTAETDWLTTEQANWLFELFESPSVYVQDGDQMVGVIITNASEQYKTNPRGQKVFKFTIQYRKSNSKHSRY